MPRSCSIRRLTVLLVVLCAAVLAPAAQAASSPFPSALMSGAPIGTIALTGSPNLARGYGATVTVLGNGKVLVAGGQGSDFLATASAEIYDPSTGKFTPTGGMNEARYSATGTLLRSGKVLIAGGVNGAGHLNSAELYDPSAGTFTATASMHDARRGATATLLSSGNRVLIAGGFSGAGTNLASAEVFRESSGCCSSAAFDKVGDLATARTGHTATLLPNAKVLITGGSGPLTNLDSAEIYDPSTQSFTSTGSMLNGRIDATATLLGTGKVLVAGGCQSGPCDVFLAKAELYDPASGKFKATGAMTDKRMSAAATLLANGQVLVSGGGNSEGVLNRYDVYDPVSGSFKRGGQLGSSRDGHQSVRLPSGKVLLVGGYGQGAIKNTSVEIYTPQAGAPLDQFTPFGALRQPGNSAASALLKNGKVLIVGGSRATSSGSEAISTARLYDPATGTHALGDMHEARGALTATRLLDGRVLITGGERFGDTYEQLATAEVFDPSTGRFTVTGKLHSGRSRHTATLLRSGKVLIAGGAAKGEIYDPAKGTFAETGSMGEARDGATATLLPSGKVLLAGGFGGIGPVKAVEIFNPATGRFTKTADMSVGRVLHTATLLPSGKVLIAGGDDEILATDDSGAELYDPSTGKFSVTGSLVTGRSNAAATLLRSGKVLVSGGEAGSQGNFASAELYDPATGKFTSAGALGAPRGGATATLLGSGKVLVAGGNTSWASDELYNPMPARPAKPVVRWTRNKRLVTATVNRVSGVSYKLTARLGRKVKVGRCRSAARSKVVCTLAPGAGRWVFSLTPHNAGGNGRVNAKAIKL